MLAKLRRQGLLCAAGMMAMVLGTGQAGGVFVVNSAPNVTPPLDTDRWVYADLTQAPYKFALSYEYENDLLTGSRFCWHRRPIWPALVALKVWSEEDGLRAFIGYWQRPMEVVEYNQVTNMPQYALSLRGMYVFARADSSTWVRYTSNGLNGDWWPLSYPGGPSVNEVMGYKNPSDVLNSRPWSGGAVYQALSYQLKGGNTPLGGGLKGAGNLSDGCTEAMTVHTDYAATHRYLVDLESGQAVDDYDAAYVPCGEGETTIEALDSAFILVRSAGGTDYFNSYNSTWDQDLSIYMPRLFAIALQNWDGDYDNMFFMHYGTGSWATESSAVVTGQWAPQASRDVVVAKAPLPLVVNTYMGIYNGNHFSYKSFRLPLMTVFPYWLSDIWGSTSYSVPAWIQSSNGAYSDDSITNANATAWVYLMTTNVLDNPPDVGLSISNLRYVPSYSLTVERWNTNSWLNGSQWWDASPRAGDVGGYFSVDAEDSYVEILPNRDYMDVTTLYWSWSGASDSGRGQLVANGDNTRRIRAMNVRYWMFDGFWDPQTSGYGCDGSSGS